MPSRSSRAALLLGAVLVAPAALAQTTPPPAGERPRMQVRFEGLSVEQIRPLMERLRTAPDSTRQRVFRELQALPAAQQPAYVQRELAKPAPPVDPYARRTMRYGASDGATGDSLRTWLMGLPEDQRMALMQEAMALGETDRRTFLLDRMRRAARPASSPAAAAAPARASAPPAVAPARRAVSRDTAYVRGVVRDSSAGDVFPGAQVMALYAQPATPRDTLAAATVANADGQFLFALRPGTYRIRYVSPGFRRVSRSVTVAGGELVTLPTTSLVGGGGELGELVVEGAGDQVRVSGDTLTFSAQNVTLVPGATTEDLVRRVPGVNVENGQITANGRAVRRVTVDGQEFFGDDAAATLRNLPADLVRDVQVLDQASEQSRFTGFDDGNRETTINLVTRPDRRVGLFGRASAGAAPEGRYIVDGVVNRFQGAQRMSVTFLTNNVNQTNFSFEDLASTGQMGGMGGGMRRGGSAFSFGRAEGDQATHALGLNYSNRWGQTQLSLSGTGSASVNNTDALTRQLYTETSPVLSLARDSADSRLLDRNARFTGRLETPLGARTTLLVQSRASYQGGTSSETTLSDRFGQAMAPISSAYATLDDATDGYASLVSGLVRHRLAKPGRTVSLDLAAGLNGRLRTSDQLNRTTFSRLGLTDSLLLDARRIRYDGQTRSLSSTLAYTEPLGRSTQMQLSFSPSANWSDADQTARRLDPASFADLGAYPQYENRLDQVVTRQRGGVQVQHRWANGVRLTAGLDAQREAIASEQTALNAVPVDEAYPSVLPSLSIGFGQRPQMRHGQGGPTMVQTSGGPRATMLSGELSYRTDTNVPSASQLGRVIDVSNPLRLSDGNPLLDPSYEHSLRGNLAYARPLESVFAGLFGFVQFSNNYIGTETLVPSRDTLLTNGITLPRGGQYTRPVNLDGRLSANLFSTASKQFTSVPLSVNAGLRLAYFATPSVYNGADVESATTTYGPSLGVSTTRTRLFDANVRYSPSIVSTARTGSPLVAASEAYVQHTLGGMLRARPFGRMIVETDVNLVGYTGDTRLRSLTLWNAALGYTLPGTNPLEIRLTATDLLNQTNGLSQTAQPLYVETRETNALGRYFMLRATYRFGSFGGQSRPGAGQMGFPGGGSPTVIRVGG